MLARRLWMMLLLSLALCTSHGFAWAWGAAPGNAVASAPKVAAPKTPTLSAGGGGAASAPQLEAAPQQAAPKAHWWSSPAAQPEAMKPGLVARFSNKVASMRYGMSEIRAGWLSRRASSLDQRASVAAQQGNNVRANRLLALADRSDDRAEMSLDKGAASAGRILAPAGWVENKASHVGDHLANFGDRIGVVAERAKQGVGNGVARLGTRISGGTYEAPARAQFDPRHTEYTIVRDATGRPQLVKSRVYKSDVTANEQAEAEASAAEQRNALVPDPEPAGAAAPPIAAMPPAARKTMNANEFKQLQALQAKAASGQIRTEGQKNQFNRLSQMDPPAETAKAAPKEQTAQEPAAAPAAEHGPFWVSPYKH